MPTRPQAPLPLATQAADAVPPGEWSGALAQPCSRPARSSRCLTRPAEFTPTRSEGGAGKEGREEGLGGSGDAVAGVGNIG